MKRFTETCKWRNKWFRKLSRTGKLLWLYLWDNCDNAGVIDFDGEAASFDIGEAIDKKHLAELGDRLETISGEKLWIRDFTAFQFGELKPTSIIHQSVIKLLRSHGLPIQHDISHGNGILMGCQPHKEEEKDKEEEKEKEGGCKGGYHPHTRTVLYWLNEKTGLHYREVDSNLVIISQRLSEPEVTLEGVKAMIDHQVRSWTGTEMAKYLRPETLFCKSKFDSYYANRNEPIRTQASKPNPRNDYVTKGPTDYAAAAARKAERDRLTAPPPMVPEVATDAGPTPSVDCPPERSVQLLRGLRQAAQ